MVTVNGLDSELLIAVQAPVHSICRSQRVTVPVIPLTESVTFVGPQPDLVAGETVPPTEGVLTVTVFVIQVVVLQLPL